jgi:hypothetical protein
MAGTPNQPIKSKKKYKNSYGGYPSKFARGLKNAKNQGKLKKSYPENTKFLE